MMGSEQFQVGVRERMGSVAAAYRVSRTIRVEAPPESVYPHVIDLRRWVRWSPWEAEDPVLERTYGGTRRGVGATYAWSGDRDAGQVRVTEASEPRRVDLDLCFEKPFPADHQIRFDLDPEDGGAACVVTWTMNGRHRGLMRVLSLVLPVERMVGKDFELGLQQLKGQVEGTSATARPVQTV